MEANLTEKTGKSLDEWKTVLADQGFSKHGEIMTFLKKECGITHGFANFIALKYREADAASQDDNALIEHQYAGKDVLKPVYQKLREKICQLGNNIEVVSKKAAVSFKCKRQFALIQPTTKTRIDLGLKFDDTPHQGRLETSGPFGSMCTHRVRITSVDDVDAELMDWLKKAWKESS